VFVDSAAMASVCTASVSQATLSLGAAKAVQNVQNGKRAFLGQGVSGLSAPRKLAVRSFCVRAGGAAPKVRFSPLEQSLKIRLDCKKP
jgi:hypothetical protein